MQFRSPRLMGLCVVLAWAPWATGRTDAVSDFNKLADNRVPIRISLGVRSAWASDPSHIELVIGLSVTKACERAASYRIVSFQDESYAYTKFIMPKKASARMEIEVESPPGCLFPRFERTLVTLELPTPLREGVEYFVLAQGSRGEMVTGAHTAQRFIFHNGEAPAPADPRLDLAVLGLRQITPVGPGLLRLEFGPNLAVEAGSRRDNYAVRIAGKPMPVIHLGRITKVDTYLPAGWPFKTIPRHEIFLQLERPFAEGDRIELEANRAVTTAANKASFLFSAKTSLSDSIKVNQVGYLTDSPIKVAYLGRWMGSFPEPNQPGNRSEAKAVPETSGENQAKSGGQAGNPPERVNQSQWASGPALAFPRPPEFEVCREEDGATVFRGQARLIHRSGEMTEGYYQVDHSGENVYRLDFTGFQVPGRYFVSVAQVGRSLAFEIADNVYRQAFETQAYGVFAQRCGLELAPPYSDWHRIACHTNGIVLTTQVRDERHDIRDLAKKIQRHPVAARPDAAMAKLNTDPALLAYYPLAGRFNDASGHGHDLTPLASESRFTADTEILPNNNQVLGPTQAGRSNGATAQGISANVRNGYTMCGWFKKDENNDFHGTLFGFGTGEWGKPRMLVTVNWGVLEFTVGKTNQATRYERINDNHWHHVGLVIEPPAQDRQRASLYVDGRRACSGDIGAQTEGDFSLATITGAGAANAYFDDFRLYGRALSAEEIRVLALPRPSEAPTAIRAFGGHHDAGDYNPRSHLDVAQTLMDAYEMAPRKFYDGQLNIPENSNGVPDILDEAFWALRLWIGLQEEDGGVHNGTESAGDPNFIETVELDRVGDYAYAKDAPGSYTFAGAMAQAARLWRSMGKNHEAEDFLRRAMRAYEWAEKHPPSTKTPRDYAMQYEGPKAYAAVQLLHTTGEPRFNRDFLEVCIWSRKPGAELEVYQEYDQSLAAWAYANCPETSVDQGIQRAARQAIFARADMFIRYCETMSYAFIRHPMAPVNWGTGAYENALPVVMWAYRLTGSDKYREWMVRTCDNTLGANPLNRSYIVGLGARTVHAPLHNSRYSHLGEVVAGQQVEGPVQSGDGYRVRETAYPQIRENFASLQTFVDCHFAINMDEGVVSAQARSMAAFGMLLPDQP